MLKFTWNHFGMERSLCHWGATFFYDILILRQKLKFLALLQMAFKF